MTAQIKDPIYYNGKKWNLIASSEDFMFDPKDYGLEPVSPATCCYDGYYGEYDIRKDSLVLKRLWICLGWPGYPGMYDEAKEGPEYPPLLGVEATEIKSNDGFPDIFDHYYDLNKEIIYSGKMLLGCDFLKEYYVHMGYQQAWSYKTVYEFEFKEGVLVNIVDLSECVVELRKDINNNPSFIEDVRSNIPLFISNSFATDYENKAWWIEKYREKIVCADAYKKEK